MAPLMTHPNVLGVVDENLFQMIHKSFLPWRELTIKKQFMVGHEKG